MMLEFLAGGGETGALMRAKDWSRTPLGPPESWPQSLRTVVGIVLTSRFAMWMGWGPDLLFFYNDAYAPTLGVKHPWAMGKPAREVWEEIWGDIGPRIDTVLSTGIATWDEGLLLFLERSGFPEETYHTFSYSPLTGESGGVSGMLCVVSEETVRVIGERRLGTLRELASEVAVSQTEREVLDVFAERIGANDSDLPFTLTYLFDEAGESAHLVSSTGIAAHHVAAPSVLRLAPDEPMWPAREIHAHGVPVVVDDLQARFADLPCGAWNRPARQALLVPIAQQGQARPAGFLVAAINPYRSLDAEYRGFVDLVAGQLAAGIAGARAFAEERRRAEALAQIDHAKTAFFSNISHEFRTPLTLMLSPVEQLLALAGDDLARTGRPLLELAHRNALRLLKLVNSLLDFSRTEAGRVQAAFEPTDLAGLTSDLASSFRSALDRAGLALDVACPALREPVFVDRDMWEKIVLNLLSNAFKFTFAGAISVAVRAGPDGTSAELLVRDTGTGIPPEELPRLFERFHRIEGARGRTFEGSGIGLALVHELVHLHGGDIRVESAVDQGTTFIIAIPFGTAHLPQDRIRAAGLPAPTTMRTDAYVEEALRWLGEDEARDASGFADLDPLATEMPPRSANQAERSYVLIADDNADMRAYVARLLGAYHEVVTVPDGAAALAAIRDRRPDLVLSDVMMPRVDGFALLREIRSDAALRDIPVILVSARAGQEAQVDGLDAGADDYLAKPFAARELIARVNTNLTLARGRRESVAQLQLAIEAGALGTFVLDIPRGTMEWSERTALILGLPPERTTISAQECEQLVYPDDRERVIASFTAVAAGDVAFHEEFRILRISGDLRWVRVEALLRRDGGGMPVQLNGAIRDITDERRSQDALHQLNEELEARIGERTRERDRIWRLSRDIMSVGRVDSTLIAVNPAWADLLGWTEAELVGRRAREFVHPEDLAATEQEQALRTTGRATMNFENRLRRRDGSYRWIAWTAVPADGLVYSMGRDITEQKGAAEALASANRQLHAQIEERERVEATLRQMQRLEAVGQLTSGVAHDFNNLLTVVLGSVEFLRKSPLLQGQERRLDMIRMAAERGANLTVQLLAFSRRQRLEPKPVDLNDVVVGMTDLMRSTLGGTVRLETRLAPDLWVALVDQTQIELVILNLAINARDAMPRGGPLTIETSNATLDEATYRRPEEPAAGEYVAIAVHDGGTGMTEEVLAKAFEPFFTTKGIGKGSGLGLAQVYGFAKQSGGGVRIDTKQGEGTSVTVFLPRADKAAGTSSDQMSQARVDAIGTRRPVVLLVDDDDAVRDVTAMMLDELGYDVLEANNGSGALATLASEAEIAVMLVDFAMPDMNGVDVVRQATALRPELPSLFVTGYVDTAALATFGEDRIVTKPFRGDDLRRKLEAALALAQRNGNIVRLRPGG